MKQPFVPKLKEEPQTYLWCLQQGLWSLLHTIQQSDTCELPEDPESVQRDSVLLLGFQAQLPRFLPVMPGFGQHQERCEDASAWL